MVRNTNFSWASRLAGAALLLVLTAGVSWAQDQSRLTGAVTDTTGAAIPGAKLTLSNVATGVTATSESNEVGVYVFPYVAPGVYSLQTEVAGFKTSNQTGVILETGTTRSVNVQMEIGELTEVITVEATTPQLEASTSSVGQFIERETVFNMPMISRRSASLVRLLGNISFRSEDGGEQIPKFSMAGGRSQNQMWTLDGIGRSEHGDRHAAVGFESSCRVPARVQGRDEQLLRRIRPRRRRLHRDDDAQRNERIPRRRVRVLPQRRDGRAIFLRPR